MGTITLTLSEDAKAEIKSFCWVNWSEVARDEFVRQEERAELFKQLEEFTKNSTLTDEDALRLGRKVNKAIAERLGISKGSKGAK